MHSVSWRWQPPVLSPVSSRALLDGAGVAMGWRSGFHDGVVAALRERYHAGDALLTNSGTSALILALRKLLPPGGTVALPGYACIDLTAAAVGAGVRVRLYDIDPTSLSPDIDSLRKALARGVDAVVVAHLFGYPADIAAVRDIADPLGIPVIEDAAQGAGGTLRNKLLGSLGDVAVLSFGRGKGMTGGSGGAMLVKPAELAEWTSRMRGELGQPAGGGVEVMALAAQSLLGHPAVYRVPASIPALRLGEMVYRHPTQARPMAAAAVAMLRAALELDDQVVLGRRARANVLLSRITPLHHVTPVRPIAGGESGYLRLAILDDAGTRLPRPAVGALRGYPMTLEEHEQIRPLLHRDERAGTGSETLRDRLFTLPTHSRVQSADLSRLEVWLSGQ
jgi:perosamine synthetase